MLFKEAKTLLLKFALIQISKPFHLLEEMRQENIFTEQLAILEKELRLTWELKIMLL